MQYIISHMFNNIIYDNMIILLCHSIIILIYLWNLLQRSKISALAAGRCPQIFRSLLRGFKWILYHLAIKLSTFQHFLSHLLRWSERRHSAPCHRAHEGGDGTLNPLQPKTWFGYSCWKQQINSQSTASKKPRIEEERCRLLRRIIPQSAASEKPKSHPCPPP